MAARIPPHRPPGMAGRSAFLFKDGKCVYADYKGHTSDQAQVILDFLKSNTN